jgi:hypothetical protein
MNAFVGGASFAIHRPMVETVLPMTGRPESSSPDHPRSSPPPEMQSPPGTLAEEILGSLGNTSGPIQGPMGGESSPVVDLLAASPAFYDTLVAALGAQAGAHLLDPLSESGALACGIGHRIRECKIICLSPSAGATLIPVGPSIERVSDEPKGWLLQTDAQFDFVATMVSCTGDRAAFDGFPVSDSSPAIRDYPQALLTLYALSRLKEGGRALILSDSKFLRYDDPESVFARMSVFGLSVDAILTLPESTPQFRVPSGDGSVVIVSRKSQGLVFVGELTGYPDRDRVLIGNLASGHVLADPKLGRLVPRSSLRPNRYLFLEDRVKSLANREGLSTSDFTSLAMEINAPRRGGNQQFEAYPNSLYFPVSAELPPVSDLARLQDPAVEVVQVVFDASKVSAEFLEGFLSTGTGELQRALGADLGPRRVVTVSSLRRWKLYIPPRPIQDAVLKVGREAAKVAGDAGAEARRCWEHPNAARSALQRLARMEEAIESPDWVDVLPYPLASVLWFAYSAANDSKVWVERAFHFFQALAQFNAALLLGPWTSSPGAFGGDSLAKMGQILSSEDLDAPSFGTWVSVAQFLGACVRRALAAGPIERSALLDVLATDDSDELAVVTSSEIFSSLGQVVKLRNDWPGHGGQVTDEVVETIRAQLSAHLSRVKGVISTRWSDLKLAIPESARFHSGTYMYEVQEAMGTRIPFHRTSLPTSRPMQDRTFHVCSRLSGLHFQLSPLIRTRETSGGTPVCYFYNRREGVKLRFVSYQFGGEPELIEPFVDTARFISAIPGVRTIAAAARNPAQDAASAA